MAMIEKLRTWWDAVQGAGTFDRPDHVEGMEFKAAKPSLASKAIVYDSCTGCQACLLVQPRYDPDSGKLVMADDARAEFLPTIGCLVSLIRYEPDSSFPEPKRKIAVNFDTCVGCGYCERICSGQSIGDGKFASVIWDAIEVKKGEELEARAAEGEHDTEPYYFAGVLTVTRKATPFGKARSETIECILHHHRFAAHLHPGAPPEGVPVASIFLREEGVTVRYRLRDDNTYDPDTRSTVILHEAVRELFGGMPIEEAVLRFPQYRIVEQEVGVPAT